MTRKLRGIAGFLIVVGLAGCRTPYDYTNFRSNKPRSIVILPPLNESPEAGASYNYLSTVTSSVAEKGFYVFPVAVVDHMMKENGLPSPNEMHEVSLKKLNQIFGADSVLYLNLKEYGTKYQVVQSVTRVTVHARLVDTRSGDLLWKSAATAENNSSSGSSNLAAMLVGAVVSQAVNSSVDHAHTVSYRTNEALFFSKDSGLLNGPRHNNPAY